jgi:hypothetical protein
LNDHSPILPFLAHFGDACWILCPIDLGGFWPLFFDLRRLESILGAFDRLGEERLAGAGIMAWIGWSGAFSKRVSHVRATIPNQNFRLSSARFFCSSSAIARFNFSSDLNFSCSISLLASSLHATMSSLRSLR